MADIPKPLRAVALILCCLGPVGLVPAQGAESVRRAVGVFAVSMEPATDPSVEAGITLGQFFLKKTFSGDMTGTSSGQMLTATTATEGSAGYVAIERFSGTVHGRLGTFVLQHSGTMQGERQALSISIVPDSGTAELQGIAGDFELKIEGGEHFYTLKYSLPDPEVSN